MEMKKLYLVGHINPNIPKTLAWREEAKDLLSVYFDVLSSTRTALSEDPQALSNDGACDSIRNSREIVQACYSDVQRADILLAMLDDFKSPRPMRGTLFELAWAWEKHTPVIGVCTDIKPMLDPFLKAAVTVWKESLSVATDHLIEAWS